MLRCVANVLETLLCLLLLRDDFPMRWRRLLLALEGMGYFLAFVIGLIPWERWRLEVRHLGLEFERLFI